jgi:site-specific recombinase XerD
MPDWNYTFIYSRFSFKSAIHPHSFGTAAVTISPSKGYDTRIIQDYLGHKQIQHTVKYTQLAPNRFKVIRWD